MPASRSMQLLTRAVRGQNLASRSLLYAVCRHLDHGVSSRTCQVPLTPSVLSSPCNLPPFPSNSLIGKNSFSSSSGSSGMFGWVRDKFEEREKGKQAAKLVDQIELMANAETWTLKMFVDEVEETLSSWRTKVPGMGGQPQVKAAKATQKVAKAMLEQFGGNATADDLNNLDRKEKLKLSIACEMPLDDVNPILQQFRNMELMHRILRYRKANGKALPTDEAGLKMAMQQDGMKVMTNEEKRMMKEMYAKKQARS